jgi:transposase InsO family protein
MNRSAGKYVENAALPSVFITNGKINLLTERTFRTMKEDCSRINEFETYEQVLLSIDQWINFYNNQYIHSAIEHINPYTALLK